MDFQSFIKSRVATGGLILVLAVVAFITAELYLQKREVDSEVEKLQNLSGSLQQDNQQLAELIKYLETPEYKEKEAREKLNLKKEGEEVVVLPKDDTEQVAGVQIHQSNPKKWFKYIFPE